MQNSFQIDIETPENITFGYNLAGIGSRFLAAFVDSIIKVGLLIISTLSYLFLADNLGLTDYLGWFVALYTITNFIILTAYQILFEMVWNGQTPGKRVFSLRVVDSNGVPVSFTASLIRNLVRVIDFLPSFYGLGIATMFINVRQRRLGDIAAGTLVVIDKNIDLDDFAMSDSSVDHKVDGKLDVAAALPVGLLDQRDIEIAESYISRQSRLGTPIQLIRPILLHLYSKMGEPIEKKLTYGEAFALLKAIVVRYRQPVAERVSAEITPSTIHKYK